jgi:hypothetical protein
MRANLESHHNTPALGVSEFSSMACYNRVRQRQHPEAQGAGEAELIA